MTLAQTSSSSETGRRASAAGLPTADGQVGFQVLRRLLRERSPLAAMAEMRAQLGPVFRVTLPGFSPTVLLGPSANRQLLVTDRDRIRWRTESDPVTRLLRYGLLVVDGERHQQLRQEMAPALQRGPARAHVPAMIAFTDQVTDAWDDGGEVDMLVAMRRLALLILMGTLFGEDVSDDLPRIWTPILKAIQYISPGAWIFGPDLPRPGYKRYLQALDEYLYELIAARRAAPTGGQDLLTHLIDVGLDDDLIRDQLLTMLIAGHDTSTALLAWALYLLGEHPAVMARVRAEVDDVLDGARPAADHLAGLVYLEQVIKETLRLYPPIHMGNRQSEPGLVIDGYEVPAGERVMYSIYLTQRDPEQWDEPDAFRPERFDRSQRRQRDAFAYVPFGGGPRNCIGAGFARVEAPVVLARLLQTFDLELVSDQTIHAHMGATLEPRPGVKMRVRRRGNNNN